MQRKPIKKSVKRDLPVTKPTLSPRQISERWGYKIHSTDKGLLKTIVFYFGGGLFTDDFERWYLPHDLAEAIKTINAANGWDGMTVGFCPRAWEDGRMDDHIECEFKPPIQPAIALDKEASHAGK